MWVGFINGLVKGRQIEAINISLVVVNNNNNALFGIYTFNGRRQRCCYYCAVAVDRVILGMVFTYYVERVIEPWKCVYL